MSGVLFIVCIPTENEEIELLKSKPYINNNNINEDRVDAINEKANGEVCRGTSQPPVNQTNQVKIVFDHCDDQKSSIVSSSPHGTLRRSESLEDLSQIDDHNDGKPFRRSWHDLSSLSKSPLFGFKSKTKKTTEKPDLITSICKNSSMEVTLRDILVKVRVKNAIWIKSDNKKLYQIHFMVENGHRQENILQMLREYGIGIREGSIVSMIPCSVFYRSNKPESEDPPGVDDSTFVQQKESTWQRFMNTVQARINVAQIIGEVKQGAKISFDFVALLVVAGILAAFGLVEDSTVLLVSSMLVSPLMGPVIAAIFGTVVKDKELRRIGMFNELIGIILATTVGFLFGLIIAQTSDKYGTGNGVTAEMLSRTDGHAILIGILIAIPSGAAVAIAILGENIGSLVGVAISASILPPAVNSGLLWAISSLYLLNLRNPNAFNSVITTTVYSQNQGVELAVYGLISMCVTLTNVICIYGMGILFLKIKEIAPIGSHNSQNFWQHDLKLARDYKAASAEASGMERMFADELIHQQMISKDISYKQFSRLSILGQAHYQNTWSPRMVTLNNQSSVKTDKRLTNEIVNYLNSVRASKRKSRVTIQGLPDNQRNPIKSKNFLEVLFQPNRYVPLKSDDLQDIPEDSASSCKACPTVSKKHKFVVTPTIEPVPCSSSYA